MKRRAFIAGLGSAIAWSITAGAQEPGRIYRMGWLGFAPRNAPWNVALIDALKAEGFVVGQNLVIDNNGYGLRLAELNDHVSEVVKDRVDVIVSTGEPSIRAAQAATKAIPILAIADDMVRSGFVASLGKPGGNTTGVSILATDLDGKRQEILLESVPGVHRIAALADANTTSPQQLQALRNAAQAHGVELLVYQVPNAEEIAGAIDAAKASGAGALNVLGSVILFNNRQIILPRVAAHGLPAIYQWPAMAKEGAFLGYGPRLEQIFRDIMGRQLVKLLRGTKPADIPVEQPTKFELAVNVKAAKALGLTIPESFLLRADEVIE
jgi:putative tryptophan/tyrosine transport system substrate-binding protein